MTVRVVGAGLGRTGTMSLRVALPQLLGGRCYHMSEVFERPQDVAVWHAATRGTMPDWHAFFDGYTAVVDWPVSAFWREISTAFPEAIVLLSVRDPDRWWRSASRTIFPSTRRAEGPWREMIDDLFASRFVADLEDREACIAAFRAHNQRVRDTVPPSRLLEWQAADGWEPICSALGVAVPAEPFPHVNTTEQFLAAGH